MGNIIFELSTVYVYTTESKKCEAYPMSVAVHTVICTLQCTYNCCRYYEVKYLQIMVL